MGTGRFGVAITGGLAGDLVGDGTLDLGLFGEMARLSASVPALGAFGNATMATAAPYDYRGAAVVNGLDLARLAPLLAGAPGQITGVLNATVAVNGAAGGDEPPQVHANIQQMESVVAGVPFRLLSPAAVSWQSGDVTLQQSTASLGDGGILTAGGTWSERAGATFSGSFRGEVFDVVTAARAFGFETDIVARGWMEGTVYGTHRREDLIASFDITGGSLETAEGVRASNLTASAGLSGETLTLHAISGRLDAARAGGTFSGKGRATIPAFDPMRATGRFELDTAAFESAGIEVTQTRPTAIVIDEGLVTMDDVVWEALGSQLAVGGSVDVTSGSPALNVTVQGLAVLRVLSAFVPNVGIDGTAEVDLHVGGTPGAPDLSGTVTLVDAELALAAPRIVVSELSGPVTLGANRIELRGLTGSANGGSLTIDGGFVVTGTDIADGEVHVQAVGMAVEYPHGLRSEVDALLTYDIGEATPILRGDVRVQRSSYTDPISLAALARANSAATVRSATGESALDGLRLDVAVTTVDDMRVDNNYGRFDSGAQLRIVGTAARPGMSGQVTLREGGRIYVAGRTFTLTGGTISFTDLTRIQPDMNIQAQTRVAGIGSVTLSLQGTPDRFEFDLTAEDNPQVSREEIATALLGGGVTGANALTLLSTDLLGASGRQIGLDAVRLERGDTVTDEFRDDPSAVLQDEDPVTRLTLSKRLSDQIEFTISQNLAESGRTTILVSYYPLPNLELRAISRDDGTQGIGIRHQMTFGGAAAPRVPLARPTLTVDRVLIDGTLAPFTADELRRDLKVAPGRRFDYYEWQQDLDRLTARYVGVGHYEARVRGRRDPTGNGAITVVYTVSPGPATRIVVDGIEVPETDLQEIRQAWVRGVFDRFIVQDAEARVQGLLVSRGYVNGIVTGTMESSSEYKTLRLTVVPGTVSGGREMRFTGNVAISRHELETAVIQWNMAEYGWADREALAATIRAYYRQRGYLNARVSVGAPIEEAGRAVLPVTIEEGSRATIRAVQWSGVSEEHRLAAERAAGLDVGAPYALALVEAARDRVDRRYRRLGHNTVQVTASATPSPETGQVDVSIVVTEGAQQVLQSVETVGATRTREGVVRRALHLPIGQPANLEEWALARKRLFDTNVFRSVDIQAIPLGDPVNGLQYVQARVAVEEYPPWRFRYGLQADREPGDGGEDDPTDINLGGIAEIRNQNLFGRGITGGGAALVEKDFQRGQVFLQSAAFFGLPLRSGLSFSISTENIRYDTAILYKEDRRTFTFEQRWRRRRGFQITYGYRYERLHDYDPDPNPDDPFPFDLVTNVGRLRSAFIWDRRTEPVSPTSGTFTSVSFERAATWLGADAGYGRVLAQQFAFRTIGPVVLAGRVMAGDFSGDPSVDLFRAGGATSVRGYGENTLGPVDFDGSFSGGTSLLILNQEVRFPMYRWLQGVGFVDVGNTFGPRYPFAWDELKVGYGLGLRFSSPIGLLRLDYGIPGSTLTTSTRRANEFGSGRFYFGLGHIF
jgi:outer membrane protein insertion porin family